MTSETGSIPFDALLARSGITLPATDVPKLRELVKAMDAAASIVNEPLPPATLPATALALSPRKP